MIRCNNCGTDNLDGSEYCDECGMKLNASVAPSLSAPQGVKTSPSAPPIPGMPQMPPMARQVAPPAPPQGPGNSPLPRPAQPSVAASRQASEPPSYGANKSTGSPPPPPPPFAPPGPGSGPSRGSGTDTTAGSPSSAATSVTSGVGANYSAGGSKTTARAKLVIQRGGTIGKEFVLTDSESNIGRWDADGGIFPDVDLDQDDPEAKVSRRHARIIHQSGQYLIEDLGSTNGTFINRGRRLLPGNRHPLNNGDEIIVGKTFLKFVVE
jgi:hypothetical protein